MFAPTPLTEAQLRDYSDEHLAYEATNLFLAGRIVPTLTARPATVGVHGIHMAVIESFAMHLRNVIDFFYKEKPQATDVVAGHFFDDWGAQRPALSSTLDAARIRANKEVAHLTTQRIAGTPANKAWQPQPLLLEVRGVITKFLVGASDARLGAKAKQRLRDLMEQEIDLNAPV